MRFPIPEPENTVKTRAFLNCYVSVSMPGSRGGYPECSRRGTGILRSQAVLGM